MSRSRRGFRTGTRFIFGLDFKPMKFKGFKPVGNPFRGAILMQEGGMTPEQVDSTLFANKDKNFINRFINKGVFPNIPNDGLTPTQQQFGSVSTHEMESSDNFSYPTIIQNRNGQLTDLKRIPYRPSAAYDNAMRTGQYIQFPTEQQAQWFSENGYKTGAKTGMQVGGSKKPTLEELWKLAQQATPQSLPKPTPSVNPFRQVNIGQTTQDKNIAYRNYLTEKDYSDKIEQGKTLIEEQQALAAKESNKPFTFPDGSSKTIDQMDFRERGYLDGKILRNKGRWNQNDPTPTSWYNPVAMLYDMAAGLGESPYKAKQSNSNLPYLGAIASPLAAGALGSIGAKTTGQFVNNLINPIPFGSKQEFLDIIQTLKNNKLKNVTLSKDEEALLNSTRVVGHLVNSGNVDNSLSVLQSLKNKSNNLSDDAFEKLAGFKKSEIDDKIKALTENNSKKQNIVEDGYQSGSYRPDDIESINLTRPPRRRSINNFEEGTPEYQELYDRMQNLRFENNQLATIPNEIFINDILNTNNNLFNIRPKPESILSRIRNRIDMSVKQTDMPVTESLIPSLSKNQNNNPVREILEAYNKVKNSEKGKSFIPAHSLSSDSYNRLSLPLIERGLKDNIIDLNYHGLTPLNTMGFPTRAGLKPELILNEINSKISNINRLTGKKYPFGELSGKDIFYPQFSVTRKQKGGPIVDPQGQYNHPGENTLVPTKDGRITMQGIPYNMIGVDETGHTQLMRPNQEYQFRGKNVFEIPLMQGGGKKDPITVFDKNDPRLRSYQDSLYNYKSSLKSTPSHLLDTDYVGSTNFKPESLVNVNPKVRGNMKPVHWDNYVTGEGFNKDYPEYTIARYKKPSQPYIFQERPQDIRRYNNSIINPESVKINTNFNIPKLNPQFLETPKPKLFGTWNAVWRDEQGQQQQKGFENETDFQNFVDSQKNYDIHRNVTQYSVPGNPNYRKEILLNRSPKMKQGGISNPYKKQQGGQISMQEAYDFLFGKDEQEIDDKPTAPSESEIEQIKEEQFIAGQREAEKRFKRQGRRDDSSVMEMINNSDIDNLISGMSFLPQGQKASNNVGFTSTGNNAYKSQGNAVPSTPLSKTAKERAKSMIDYLQSKHTLPKHVAAGITANAYAESAFRDDVLSGKTWGDKGTSFGLFQWRGDRNKKFFNWAKQNNKNPYDMYTQIDYGIIEANQRGDLQKVLQTNNAHSAANIWMRKFEVPAKKDLEEKVRGNKANEFMQYQIGGTYDVDPVTLLELRRKGYKYKIV